MVTVYTKKNCPQCNATKRRLDKKNIGYNTVNIEDHPELLDDFKSAGYMSAPVVVVDGQGAWSGYRPDLIDNIEI